MIIRGKDFLDIFKEIYWNNVVYNVMQIPQYTAHLQRNKNNTYFRYIEYISWNTK